MGKYRYEKWGPRSAILESNYVWLTVLRPGPNQPGLGILANPL